MQPIVGNVNFGPATSAPSTSDLRPPTSAAPATAPIIHQKPDGSRFASTNIRLSSALCALGFSLRTDAEPVSVAIDVAAERRIVTFWHSYEPAFDSPLANATYEEHGERKPLKIVAIDVQAWWQYPGKFSIPGFDDALTAIRRVHEAREFLLHVINGRRRIVNERFTKNSVITTSLHFASVLKACGFSLLAYEKNRQSGSGPGRGSDRFVFPARAVAALEMLIQDKCERRDDGRDACVDWMLWGLKYRDWLACLVADPGCIPMIEMRDGERVLRISSKMPKTLRKEWVSYL